MNSNIFANIVSGLALMISIGALVISLLDSSANKKHNRLSMRPYIQFASVRVPYEPYQQVGVYIANHGTGIAVIESVRIMLDGQPVKDGPNGVLHEALKELGLAASQELDIKFPLTLQEAVPPGEQILLWGVDKEKYTKDVGIRLQSAFNRISIEIVYKSLYEERFEISLNKHSIQ